MSPFKQYARQNEGLPIKQPPVAKNSVQRNHMANMILS